MTSGDLRGIFKQTGSLSYLEKRGFLANSLYRIYGHSSRLLRITFLLLIKIKRAGKRSVQVRYRPHLAVHLLPTKIPACYACYLLEQKACKSGTRHSRLINFNCEQIIHALSFSPNLFTFTPSRIDQQRRAVHANGLGSAF